MRCPSCGDSMETEYVPLVGQEVGLFQFRHSKSWHCRCEECDSEWVKVGHEKLRLIDGMFA